MKYTQKMMSIIQSREGRVEKILLALLLVLCMAIAVKAVSVLGPHRSIGGTVAGAVRVLDEHGNKAPDYQKTSAARIQKLNENGIFCPEKKKPSPPQVAGILGDSALINDKWCRVGEEHAGAKVLKIESTEVTVLWEGKETKLAPLLASRPSGSDPNQNEKRKKAKSAAGENRVDRADVSDADIQPQDDMLDWIDIDIDDDVRDFLNQAFELMPGDQLDNIKNEWGGLSDEEKQQRLNEVREILDSGQADRILEDLRNSRM